MRIGRSATLLISILLTFVTAACSNVDLQISSKDDGAGGIEIINKGAPTSIESVAVNSDDCPLKLYQLFGALSDQLGAPRSYLAVTEEQAGQSQFISDKQPKSVSLATGDEVSIGIPMFSVQGLVLGFVGAKGCGNKLVNLTVNTSEGPYLYHW